MSKTQLICPLFVDDVCSDCSRDYPWAAGLLELEECVAIDSKSTARTDHFCGMCIVVEVLPICLNQIPKVTSLHSSHFQCPISFSVERVGVGADSFHQGCFLGGGAMQIRFSV